MVTERELEADIIEILACLGKTDQKIPDTHKGKSEMLSALKKELKANEEAEAKAKEEAEAKANEEVEAKANEEVEAPSGYFVKPGVSVTSKKGLREPGDEIKVEWIGGGKQALDALVKSGHVEYRK